jgi:hypothetical protein
MLYFLLGLILIVTLILAAPVSLGYRSPGKWLTLRWLGMTFTRELGQEKPGKPRKSGTGKKKGRTLANLRVLWQARDLVRELIGKLLKFAWELCRTLDFRNSEATFSLPDPMWNGMLAAVLLNLQVQNIDLSVNFEERNYAKIWVTIYPYRVLGKVAVFLCRLPYVGLVRLAWDLKKLRQTG